MGEILKLHWPGIDTSASQENPPHADGEEQLDPNENRQQEEEDINRSLQEHEDFYI